MEALDPKVPWAKREKTERLARQVLKAFQGGTEQTEQRVLQGGMEQMESMGVMEPTERTESMGATAQMEPMVVTGPTERTAMQALRVPQGSMELSPQCHPIAVSLLFFRRRCSVREDTTSH